MVSNEMSHLAREWLEESRSGEPKKSVDFRITMMLMTGTSDDAWHFILSALSYANGIDELEKVAIGPIESFVFKHRSIAMDLIEGEYFKNEKLRTAINAVLIAADPELGPRIEQLRKE